MFERFTDEARETVLTAQSIAHQLWHDQADTAHLLLALSMVPGDDTGTLLTAAGLTPEFIQSEIVERSPRGMHEPAGTRSDLAIGFTVALEKAMHAARARGKDYIGTEHLLLGLVTDSHEDTALAIIQDAGTTPDAVDQTVTSWLATAERPEADPAPADPAPQVTIPALSDASPLPGTEVTAVPDAELTGMLRTAAARALADGRTEYGMADLDRRS